MNIVEKIKLKKNLSYSYFFNTIDKLKKENKTKEIKELFSFLPESNLIPMSFKKDNLLELESVVEKIKEEESEYIYFLDFLLKHYQFNSPTTPKKSKKQLQNFYSKLNISKKYLKIYLKTIRFEEKISLYEGYNQKLNLKKSHLEEYSNILHYIEREDKYHIYILNLFLYRIKIKKNYTNEFVDKLFIKITNILKKKPTIEPININVFANIVKEYKNKVKILEYLNFINFFNITNYNKKLTKKDCEFLIERFEDKTVSYIKDDNLDSFQIKTIEQIDDINEKILYIYQHTQDIDCKLYLINNNYEKLSTKTKENLLKIEENQRIIKRLLMFTKINKRIISTFMKDEQKIMFLMFHKDQLDINEKEIILKQYKDTVSIKTLCNTIIKNLKFEELLIFEKKVFNKNILEEIHFEIFSKINLTNYNKCLKFLKVESLSDRNKKELIKEFLKKELINGLLIVDKVLVTKLLINITNYKFENPKLIRMTILNHIYENKEKIEYYKDYINYLKENNKPLYMELSIRLNNSYKGY